MTDTEFRRLYDNLTATLSRDNETLLRVGLPALCNADTDDVEHFIVEHWQKPVDDNNFEHVGHEFKRWFGERYPEEYVSSNFALGIPPPTTKKRSTDKNWRSRPSQNPQRWRETKARGRQRRNEVAQSMGFDNSGDLLSTICKADPTIRQQIAELLNKIGS